MDEAIGQRFAIVGETRLLATVETDAVCCLVSARIGWRSHGVRAALLRPDR